jgi:class 3 adenylate cyclase
MALADDITSDVNGVLNQTWNMRDGQVVPDTIDVALAGGGVNLKATVLYADLADSTGLAMWDRRVAARVFKAFLAASTRIIRAQNGEIRSFDGDRVMGIFVGDYKNSSAAKSALRINWMFTNVLKPKFEAKYEAFRNGTHKLDYSTGIDTSEVLAVRGGIRDNNDLIWVGRAPNVAAKLCGIRETNYRSYMTGDVYDKINEEAKIYQGRNMWEERTWPNGPVVRIFRSSWWVKP